MMRWQRALIALLACVVLSGCVSMSRADKNFFREIRGLGLDTEIGRIKSPILAGVLNIAPGFGNFYLAGGTGESSQWGYGILNLLFWPFTVPFAVPEAAIDAGTINDLETIYYYRYAPAGQIELAAARRRAATKLHAAECP